jgi:cobalamin biosynthetic protein CobC
LLTTARKAYAVQPDAGIVAAPGTQAILQWLPQVVPARRVAVVGPTYAEHAAVWARAGAQVETVATLEKADKADLAVVVNPNNPDGRIHPPQELAAFAADRSGGVALVVDEAFGDLLPHLTVAGAPGTIVLKSFGKFYGLAGLRLGFAVSALDVTARLAAALGPWAVSGPALAIGTQALADTAWAEAMRARLTREAAELDRVLMAAGLPVVGGTDLFRLVETATAPQWHEALAAEGVWTRAFDEAPHRLRIGLPGVLMSRLEAALAAARHRV